MSDQGGDEPRRPQRAVTMQDVADHVGVSKALVSMVFRRVQGPSAETRQRVLDAVFAGAWVDAVATVNAPSSTSSFLREVIVRSPSWRRPPGGRAAANGQGNHAGVVRRSHAWL